MTFEDAIKILESTLAPVGIHIGFIPGDHSATFGAGDMLTGDDGIRYFDTSHGSFNLSFWDNQWYVSIYAPTDRLESPSILRNSESLDEMVQMICNFFLNQHK